MKDDDDLSLDDHDFSLHDVEPSPGEAAMPPTCISLLRTCSQIYHEAREALYDAITLVITSTQMSGFNTNIWRIELYSSLVRQTKNLILMLDIERPLSSNIAETLELMHDIRNLRFVLGAEGTVEAGPPPRCVSELLRLVPPSCQVIFGAGDETSLAWHVLAHYDKRVLSDGWETETWIQPESSELGYMLNNAVDSLGAKRDYVLVSYPDMEMVLENIVMDYEIRWKAPQDAIDRAKSLARRPISIPQKKFHHFFDLPIELRAQICEYTLAPEGIVGFSLDGLAPPRMTILEACKRIHQEAKDIPFMSNTFVCAYSLPGLSRTPRQQRIQVIPRIRRIALALCGDETRAGVAGIDATYITRNISDYSSLQRIRLLLYRAREDSVGWQISQEFYTLGDDLIARGYQVSFCSSTDREHDFLKYEMESFKGEIDLESINAGVILR